MSDRFGLQNQQNFIDFNFFHLTEAKGIGAIRLEPSGEIKGGPLVQLSH